MSTTYKPVVPTGLFKIDQQLWIQREFGALFRALESGKGHETFTYLHMAPPRIVPGMWVLADGTDWNPGSGVGAYRRSEDNTAWVFIGSDDDALAEAVAASEASLQVIASELQRITFLQAEQLRQTTKVALLLSAISGLVIDDSEVETQSTQVKQLTNIVTILAILAEVVIQDDEISIPIY